MTGPRKPVVALTVGDPAGIGPEVVLRALDAADRPDVPFVVYGPLASLRDRGRRFGLKTPEQLAVSVVDIPLEAPVALGVSSAAGGRAAARAVLRAAQDA
jgi:4-hydroxy-L-threonine phosphate dehydrogenase PdxA